MRRMLWANKRQCAHAASRRTPLHHPVTTHTIPCSSAQLDWLSAAGAPYFSSSDSASRNQMRKSADCWKKRRCALPFGAVAEFSAQARMASSGNTSTSSSYS
mmetsp:Transcript_24353/g.55740  ORF Transcript_24353/g.55740 Transcript_24353/m.55740 type:complete len:102 (+) Transcript_24353:299-604(+)